jgi:hypothetical protein
MQFGKDGYWPPVVLNLKNGLNISWMDEDR